MWEYLIHKRAEAKRIRDDAARESRNTRSVAAGVSFREILEHARRNEDVECRSEIMRRSYFAIRDSRWE